MIWQACDGVRQFTEVSGTLYRLVESQGQVATLKYVDTLEEQALLEEMLEAAKPPLPANTADYHYLLKTPFRYPPLRWGSRFGRVHEQGIFYAGCTTESTLAESAYYRLVFFYSIEGAIEKQNIRTEHTLFSASYQSSTGIRLHAPPFDQCSEALTHQKDYRQTQALGTEMREAGVEVFEYQSARGQSHDHCVGLFTPSAFVTKTPDEMNSWSCEVSATEVLFKQHGQSRVIRFEVDGFLYNGDFPMPAA